MFFLAASTDKDMTHLYSLTCGYLIVPAPFADKTGFVSPSALGTFAENH